MVWIPVFLIRWRCLHSSSADHVDGIRKALMEFHASISWLFVPKKKKEESLLRSLPPSWKWSRSPESTGSQKRVSLGSRDRLVLLPVIILDDANNLQTSSSPPSHSSTSFLRPRLSMVIKFVVNTITFCHHGLSIDYDTDLAVVKSLSHCDGS